MAKEPDFSKMFPRRFITMSMQDKYMAVCFIYDGLQYQDLCREQQPDGTYNYSEKCLSKLPFNLPFIGSQIGSDAFKFSSLNNSERGLVPYSQRQNPDDFPNILEAVSHYWFEVLMLCLFSALIFQLIFTALLGGRFSRYKQFLNFITGGYLFKSSTTTTSNNNNFNHQNGRYSASPKVDELGTISIGKLSFNRHDVVGRGNSGTFVYRGLFENSINCAVKRVVSQDLTSRDREVDTLRALQHPNLVRYLATEDDSQFLYIALELAETTLGALIEGNRIAEIDLSKVKLCQQSALGLQHLHRLGFVHRDIKPQNILISFPIKPNNERKVMISDFGLSRQLNSTDTTNVHSTGAMRYFDGTKGWMAPEIVEAKQNDDKTLEPTKAADIFSLGCVFYYTIFDGKHPFGNSEQRQENILTNNNLLDVFTLNDEDNLDVIGHNALLAKKLIKAMIQPTPQNRPYIGTILHHPFFWDSSKQLQFLQDVSDRIENEADTSDIVRKLNRKGKEIFGFDWAEKLSQDLQEDLNKRRKYNKRSVRDLLRAIRNKKHHYNEIPDEVKKTLGEVPNEFMNYFNLKFPQLITCVYSVMHDHKEEALFRTYYELAEDLTF